MSDNCTVKTRYGTFNGFVNEKGVKTWLGIPYAQPPVEKLSLACSAGVGAVRQNFRCEGIRLLGYANC